MIRSSSDRPLANRLEIWLVRHGETTANQSGLLSGWQDVELTKRGQAQARELKDRLDSESFDGVWSSDLSRAQQTAQIAYPRTSSIIDPRLREIDFGRLDGAPWVDLPADQQKTLLDFEGFQAPEGENLSRFTERVLDFITALPTGKHLVFTHGGVVRVVLKQLSTDRFPSNGSLCAVDWPAKNLLFVYESPLATPSALATPVASKQGL